MKVLNCESLTPARGGLLVALAVTIAGCRDTVSMDVSDPSFGRAAGASFEWAMPARFGADRDGDGLVDYPRTPEEISPSSWTVDFDACELQPAAQYEWYVNQRHVASVTSCKYSHQFSAEGTYQVALHAIRAPGPGEWAEQLVQVQDWLIVSFGDSYGSGEGVPEIQAADDELLHQIDQAINDFVAAKRHLDETAANLAEALENKGLAEDILATQQRRFNDFLDACTPDDFKAIKECADFLASLPYDTFQSARDHFNQGVEDARERLQSLTQAWQAAQAAFNSAQSAVDNIQDVIAALRAGIGTPRWQAPYPGQDWRGEDCHRSANAAPARAALALEQSDPRTSVTFIHMACSGARIDKFDGRLQQQIPLANELVGNREIDAVFLSIGGNDAGFANIATACAVQQPCYATAPAFDLADASVVCSWLGVIQQEDACNDLFGNLPAQSAKRILDEGVDSLPARYNTLAQSYFPGLIGLREPPPVYGASDRGLDSGPVRSGRVYIAEYGDMTKDDDLLYCHFDPTDPLGSMPGMTPDEMAWLDQTATHAVDGAVAAGAAAHGWTLVTGIYAAYARHGYCAVSHWVNRIHESLLRQKDINGLAHPDNAGQMRTAEAIFDAVMKDLYPDGVGGAPRAPDQPFMPGPPVAVSVRR